MSSLSLISMMDGETCGDDSFLGYFGLPIWILLVIILTVGQFVLCEEYFVPTLTGLGERFKMPQDVQGATLLAIGTSAPELYIAILGIICYPTQNPGPSTNIGSAVFNMCIIIGLSAIFAPSQTPKIAIIPFLRDSISYLVSLIMIYIFYNVTSPYSFELWESILLIIWWIIYILNVCKTSQITKKYTGNQQEMEQKDITESDVFIIEDSKKSPVILHDIECEKELIGVQYDEYGDPLEVNELNTKNPNNIHIIRNAEIADDEFDDNLHELLDDLDINQRQDVNKGYMIVANPKKYKNNNLNELESNNNNNNKNNENRFIYVRRRTVLEQEIMEENKNKNCLYVFIKLLCNGWIKIFHCFLPNIDGIFATKYVYITILMINIWLALLTFILIDGAVKIGHCMFMSTDLIGITLLAISSSISDCIASILVAKQMKIDMAISNALSSNIFDINLCIGISFVIGSIINGGKGIDITHDNHHNAFSLLILSAIFMLLILWPLILCSNFKLTNFVGFILILMYVAFILIVSSLYLLQ